VAEGAVWSSGVVVIEPDGERRGALVAVAVDGAVDPFGEIVRMKRSALPFVRGR
jgi:hypothetical protein